MPTSPGESKWPGEARTGPADFTGRCGLVADSLRTFALCTRASFCDIPAVDGAFVTPLSAVGMTMGVAKGVVAGADDGGVGLGVMVFGGGDMVVSLGGSLVGGCHTGVA